MPDPVGLLLDDFNRGTLGTDWTNAVLLGGAASGITVASNAAVRENDADYRQGAYYNKSYFGPDVSVIIDLTAWNQAAPNFEGFTLFARLTAPGATTSNGYAFDYDASTTTVSVFRVDSDVATVLATNAAVSFAAGDQAALVCSGSSIEAWRRTSGSWTLLASATDATYPGSGYVGLQINASAGQVMQIGNTYVGLDVRMGSMRRLNNGRRQ